MGSEGALFVKKGFLAECPALSVEAHSTVGAGDAMVAAIAYAWEEDLSEEETIRLCMAASAGAVTTIGTKPPKKELVEYLKTQVKIYEHSIIGSF
jgi:1-phosphofructokinase